MVMRVVVALVVIVAVIQGLAPDLVPENILPLVLVLLGLAWGIFGVDDDTRIRYLVGTIAVGAAAGADVMNHIHVIGGYIDAILDQIAVALYAGVVALIALRIWSYLMPEEGGE